MLAVADVNTQAKINCKRTYKKPSADESSGARTQFHASCHREHDIGTLQIAMDQILRVQVGQALQTLAYDDSQLGQIHTGYSKVQARRICRVSEHRARYLACHVSDLLLVEHEVLDGLLERASFHKLKNTLREKR